MKSIDVQTILYAYPHVNAVVKKINETVLKKALKSREIYTDCCAQCEEIVGLSQNKCVLLRLKHSLKLIVSRLTREEQLYLRFKYFCVSDCRGAVLDANKKRAYFRKQKKILQIVSKCLEMTGITQEWFDKYCITIPFMRKLKKYILTSEPNRFREILIKEKDVLHVKFIHGKVA